MRRGRPIPIARGRGREKRTAAASGYVSRAATASGRRSPHQHDAIEGLPEGMPLVLSEPRRSLAHASFDRGEVRELARVTGEGLDLEVHRLRDVDDQLRI